jgi:AraC-like DNA-binding protein
MAIDNQIGRHPEIFQPLRPDWFDPDRDERVIKLKEEILTLASSGAKRPVRKHADSAEMERLAEAIERFTSPSQHAYDAEFTTKLKLIRPDWFRDTKLEIMQRRDEEDKKKFIEMAASGAKRPPIKEQPKLARRLYKLINADEEFHRQIAAANPTWVGKSRDMKRFWIGLPDWLDKEYTHDGETLSIRKWATKLRCKENTLYQYLRDHTIEQAVKLHTRKKSLTCDGETLTLTQWSKKLGITPSSLFDRLRLHPPEIALSPKNWENRKK